MNLLIIGYCNLDDGFLYAAEALKKKDIKIYFFAYLSHIMDNIKDRDELLIEKINENNIDICLWWCNNITYDIYKYIFSKIGKNIKNYFFNWDIFLYDYKKYNLFVWEDRIENKKNFYPLMDHIFSCYEKEINFFRDMKNTSISYNYAGFDKDISYYEYDEEYECDISIVCTNLYENKMEFPEEATNITRYEIIEKLYINRDKLKFHIYGSDNLKDRYPDCYKGFIKYKNCNKVFSNSKINLSIHPIIYELNNKNSEEEYFSERVPQILGSKGLLMTNSYFSKYLKNNEDYIYIDREMNWFDKILNIIKNTNDFDIIRENGYIKSLKYYQWNNFANIFINHINKY
jgi:hypothetical protein